MLKTCFEVAIQLYVILTCAIVHETYLCDGETELYDIINFSVDYGISHETAH